MAVVGPPGGSSSHRRGVSADGAVLRRLFAPKAYVRCGPCITSYGSDGALEELNRAPKDKET